MTLIAPDGTGFAANSDEPIALDLAVVVFAVDREMADLAGWTLQIDDVAIQL